MEEESVISFSDQSSYRLADELLMKIVNGGPWQDIILFNEFCSAANTNIEYHTRKKIINSLLYDYELIKVENQTVELTRRGVEVAKLGIENYNRKIQENIRIKKENERRLELQKQKKKKIKTIIWIIMTILTGLSLLTGILCNICSIRG